MHQATRRRAALSPLRLVVALTISLGFVPGCNVEIARKVEHPDLVLVTWDTVRADAVGPSTSSGDGGGGPGGVSATPTLDALARSGVSFSEARTPVPITLPAHATLLTGRFPSSHGVRDNGLYALPPEIPSLAERCRDAGYATGAFVSAAVLARRYGLERGFDVYDDGVETGQRIQGVPSRRGDRTLAAALAWLEVVPSNRPLLLWLHLYDPHQLWDAPEPWSEHFDPYRAEIAFADALTGRLLEALANQGRRERALVAVTSDHGEGLGEHGEETHSYFAYESTLRVPLTLWAGSELDLDWRRGESVAGPASLADLAPTWVELANLAPLPGDGRSLAAQLGRSQAGPVPARSLPFETVAPAHAYRTAPIFGVLTADGHAWIDLPRREHYDLSSDPSQIHDLYLEQDAAAADAAFASHPRRWPPAPSTGAATLDPQTREALAALGYASADPLAPAGPGDREAIDPKDRIELFNFLSLNHEQLTPDAALVEAERLQGVYGAVPALVDFRVGLLDALGRSRTALGVLQAAVAENPDHPRMAEEWRARQEQRREQLALARAIRTTLAREPDQLRAVRDLALTLHRLEAFDEAEKRYRQVLAREPSDLDARLNLVRLLMSRGRAEEALALARDPAPAEAHDPRLDCATGRILAWYLDRPADAAAPLRRCRDAGLPLTPLDRAALAAR